MGTFFLSEAIKLKNIQIYLEKNINLFDFMSKYGGESNLCQYFTELEKERQQETDKINTALKIIMKSIKEKKEMIKNEDINNLDLKNFKKSMIEIQDNIQTLKMKVKSDLEILKDEERDIREEIEIYDKKLNEWEKPMKYFCNMNQPRVTVPESDYKEVQTFFDFVNKSNGHENGWSSEDHQLFVKLRNKHKNIENLAVQLHKLLPDISEDDVKQHEIWYRKYLFLKERKRQALNNWRKSKTTNEINVPPDADENNETVLLKSYPKTRDETAKKIALWKAEKEAQRLRKKEFEQMQQQKLKQIEEEKRRLNEEIKKSVENWKQAKITRELNEKFRKQMIEHEEKRMRAATANKLVKQFQSRDDIFITRMKNVKKKVEVKRSKSSQLVNKDPDRIFKPTKQWLSRISKKECFLDGELAAPVPNIVQVPKLGIPEWRKHM